MEWEYAQAESSNGSKLGQYGMSSEWNGIAHHLRVQGGQNEVRNERPI